jgi:hypothetical protein
MPVQAAESPTWLVFCGGTGMHSFLEALLACHCSDTATAAPPQHGPFDTHSSTVEAPGRGPLDPSGTARADASGSSGGQPYPRRVVCVRTTAAAPGPSSTGLAARPSATRGTCRRQRPCGAGGHANATTARRRLVLRLPPRLQHPPGFVRCAMGSSRFCNTSFGVG